MRTTIAAVKEIISTDLADAQITAFITAANLTVTNVLGDSGLSSETLTEIERWLAAHLLSARDQRVARRSIEFTSWTFQGTFGLGLDGTLYGQNVKLLDTTGKLAALGRSRASITIYSEQDSNPNTAIVS